MRVARKRTAGGLPRPLAQGHHRRLGAGPAVGCVRPRLPALGPLLRRLHEPRRRHQGGRVPALEARRDRADPRSARVVLRVDQPYSNHNGGLVMFGPDGDLYIGLGDGGSGGDPERNGQDLGTLLGKILRIDPRPADGDPYRHPGEQPVRRQRGRPTRDPRLRPAQPLAILVRPRERAISGSATSARTSRRRSTSSRASSAGANFGWSAFEGTARFNEDQEAPNALAPVLTYGREGGCSVTGGYVVRDPRSRASTAATCTRDFCVGQLRSFSADGRGARPVSDDLALGDPGPVASARSRRTRAGHVYAISLDGPVYRLVPGAERLAAPRADTLNERDGSDADSCGGRGALALGLLAAPAQAGAQVQAELVETFDDAHLRGRRPRPPRHLYVTEKAGDRPGAAQRRAARAAVPRHLGPGHGPGRAGPPVDRVRARLQAEPALLRLLHTASAGCSAGPAARSGSTSSRHGAAIRHARPARQPPAGDLDPPPGRRQPQRRHGRLRARRQALARHRATAAAVATSSRTRATSAACSGKLLRINPLPTQPEPPRATGSRAATRSSASRDANQIWSYGLRNPFRFSFDRERSRRRDRRRRPGQPGGGRHRHGSRRRGAPGFGWPECEGTFDYPESPPYTPPAPPLFPITTYPNPLAAPPR